MTPTPLADIPEDLVLFNRERYKSELSQGIFDLMRLYKIKRADLARMLGQERSFITRILSGAHNFKSETLADIYLALGRAPHVTLGADADEVRFPVDEGASVETEADADYKDSPTTLVVFDTEGDTDVQKAPRIYWSKFGRNTFRVFGDAPEVGAVWDSWGPSDDVVRLVSFQRAHREGQHPTARNVRVLPTHSWR